jgi:Cu-Zn family superoxide dismutase
MKTKILTAALFAAALAAPAAFAGDANSRLMIAPAQEAPAENVAEAPKTFTAKMTDSDKKDIGTAILTEMPHGLLVSIDFKNLPPGWRALHIHGTGDCSDHHDHFKKAGSHAAAEGQEHGFLSAKGPHKGDLPNIFVIADGTVKADFYTNLITAADLAHKDGMSMMVHAEKDDYQSDPAGNAGTRLACGVVE